MKFTSKDLAINACIAALYVVLTTINPIGHGMIQVRVSEMLAILPFINRKFIPGMIVGVTVANFFSPLGYIDVLVGVGCAVVSYTISYFIKNLWINVVQYAVVCGLIVSLMLKSVLGIPYWPSVIAIFVSTLIVGMIGAVIFNALKERLKLVD